MKIPSLVFLLFLLTNCTPKIQTSNGNSFNDYTKYYRIVCIGNIKYYEYYDGYNELTPYINPKTKSFENCVKVNEK